jgi:peptide/nickel transport system substrate-binding protein
VALLAGACSGGDAGDAASTAVKGQLSVLSLGPVATWDPQRMTSAQDAAFAGRVFLRTLTAFPPGPDAAAQRTVVGDLATDAGTPNDTATSWQFTLRGGVKWQDGSPVTCEDVRHGVARSFAAPWVSEGLNYGAAYLDIPRKADGTSVYTGPATTDKAAVAAFDKAVSCDGNTVTFRLSTPMADWGQVVASPSFAPVKASQDKGKDGTYAVFSNGPYQLKDPWDPSSGGTFSRNPNWDKGSDPVRKAQPETIRYLEGTESQTAAQQVLSDDPAHRQSVTLDSAPPAMQQHILSDTKLKERSVNPTSQFVDYLAPNFAKGVMRTPAVRKALALSTNRDGYIAALGGSSAATPTDSLIGPVLPGHRPDSTQPPEPDPGAARAALQGAGLTLPVKIRVAYRSTPTADKAMAALMNGWQDAGFAVTLQPLTKDYFTDISDASQVDETDVFWANWAPSWPSGGTMIRPLFDSRLNLTDKSSGRDYGRFVDAAVDNEIARIGALTDTAAQAEAWSKLDASLADRGAYVALAQRRAFYVAGTDVKGLAANEALGGFVDLATIEVTR